MSWFNFNKTKEAIRFNNGDIFTTILNGGTNYKTLTDDVKLRYMLTNPALAKVIFLNCDVFSLLQITRKDKKENDPLIKALKNPNHFQSQRQFLWTYRFWLMFGNAYLKPNNKRLDSDWQQLYWLNPNQIEWGKVPETLDRMIISKFSYNEILNSEIKYRYKDGSKLQIQLKEIIAYQDLTNGLGNWYEGNSRIDSLWKILQNTELSLDAKNINLDFSKKFLVSGNYDPTKNLSSLGTMQNVEKEDIKAKLRSSEPVHPIKSEVDIKRFVDDLAKLKLDESYNEDLSKVGNMFSVPKEVLEALKGGSTYENQEKAIGRHVSYSETPKAQDLLEGLCNFFDLNPDEYEANFNNNSFMQVFEKEKAVVNMTNARTLESYIKNGADPNAAAEYLGIDVEFKKVQNENQ